MKATFCFKLLFLIVLFNAFTSNAQIDTHLKPPKNFHQHKGFYFAAGLGPVFGKIYDNLEGQGALYNSTFNGAGIALDLRVGYGIQPDIVATADIITRIIISPTVTYKYFTSTRYSKNISISDETYGLGLTQFFQPSNIFVGGTIGLGTYVLMDDSAQTTSHSSLGFSGQVRVGKDWYLTKKLALGVCLSYSRTSTKHTESGYVERIYGNRFMVMSQISF